VAEAEAEKPFNRRGMLFLIEELLDEHKDLQAERAAKWSLEALDKRRYHEEAYRWSGLLIDMWRQHKLNPPEFLT
jgi:hypothetical protein